MLHDSLQYIPPYVASNAPPHPAHLPGASLWGRRRQSVQTGVLEGAPHFVQGMIPAGLLRRADVRRPQHGQ